MNWRTETAILVQAVRPVAREIEMSLRKSFDVRQQPHSELAMAKQY